MATSTTSDLIDVISQEYSEEVEHNNNDQDKDNNDDDVSICESFYNHLLTIYQIL